MKKVQLALDIVSVLLSIATIGIIIGNWIESANAITEAE